MPNMETVTVNIQADTTEFKRQMAEVESMLSKIPTHVASRWQFQRWTLVRIGWYIGIGLSWWYVFACFLAWLLRVILGGEVVPKLWQS